MNRTFSTEDAECQTILKCTPFFLEEGCVANLHSDSQCQTEISLSPSSSDNDLYATIAYIDPKVISEDSIRVMHIPKKMKLHFVLPELEIASTRTLNQANSEDGFTYIITDGQTQIKYVKTGDESLHATSTESFLPKVRSDDEYLFQNETSLISILKGSSKRRRRGAKITITSQTDLMVYPHYLDKVAYATVSKNQSCQTVCTFDPDSSLSNIITRLEAYLSSDSICTENDYCAIESNRSVLGILQGILDGVINIHQHLFDPTYEFPNLPANLALVDNMQRSEWETISRTEHAYQEITPSQSDDETIISTTLYDESIKDEIERIVQAHIEDDITFMRNRIVGVCQKCDNVNAKCINSKHDPNLGQQSIHSAKTSYYTVASDISTRKHGEESFHSKKEIYTNTFIQCDNNFEVESKRTKYYANMDQQSVMSQASSYCTVLTKPYKDPDKESIISTSNTFTNISNQYIIIPKTESIESRNMSDHQSNIECCRFENSIYSTAYEGSKKSNESIHKPVPNLNPDAVSIKSKTTTFGKNNDAQYVSKITSCHEYIDENLKKGCPFTSKENFCICAGLNIKLVINDKTSNEEKQIALNILPGLNEVEVIESSNDSLVPVSPIKYNTLAVTPSCSQIIDNNSYITPNLLTLMSTNDVLNTQIDQQLTTLCCTGYINRLKTKEKIKAILEQSGNELTININFELKEIQENQSNESSMSQDFFNEFLQYHLRHGMDNLEGEEAIKCICAPVCTAPNTSRCIKAKNFHNMKAEVAEHIPRELRLSISKSIPDETPNMITCYQFNQTVKQSYEDVNNKQRNEMKDNLQDNIKQNINKITSKTSRQICPVCQKTVINKKGSKEKSKKICPVAKHLSNINEIQDEKTVVKYKLKDYSYLNKSLKSLITEENAPELNLTCTTSKPKTPENTNQIQTRSIPINDNLKNPEKHNKYNECKINSKSSCHYKKENSSYNKKHEENVKSIPDRCSQQKCIKCLSCRDKLTKEFNENSNLNESNPSQNKQIKMLPSDENINKINLKCPSCDENETGPRNFNMKIYLLEADHSKNPLESLRSVEDSSTMQTFSPENSKGIEINYSSNTYLETELKPTTSKAVPFILKNTDSIASCCSCDSSYKPKQTEKTNVYKSDTIMSNITKATRTIIPSAKSIKDYRNDPLLFSSFDDSDFIEPYMDSLKSENIEITKSVRILESSDEYETASEGIMTARNITQKDTKNEDSHDKMVKLLLELKLIDNPVQIKRKPKKSVSKIIHESSKIETKSSFNVEFSSVDDDFRFVSGSSSETNSLLGKKLKPIKKPFDLESIISSKTLEDNQTLQSKGTVFILPESTETSVCSLPAPQFFPHADGGIRATASKRFKSTENIKEFTKIPYVDHLRYKVNPDFDIDSGASLAPIKSNNIVNETKSVYTNTSDNIKTCRCVNKKKNKFDKATETDAPIEPKTYQNYHALVENPLFDLNEKLKTSFPPLHPIYDFYKKFDPFSDKKDFKIPDILSYICQESINPAKHYSAAKCQKLQQKTDLSASHSQDRVVAAVKTCEMQLKPIKEELENLKTKLIELDMPEVNRIFEEEINKFDLLQRNAQSTRFNYPENIKLKGRINQPMSQRLGNVKYCSKYKQSSNPSRTCKTFSNISLESCPVWHTCNSPISNQSDLYAISCPIIHSINPPPNFCRHDKCINPLKKRIVYKIVEEDECSTNTSNYSHVSSEDFEEYPREVYPPGNDNQNRNIREYGVCNRCNNICSECSRNTFENIPQRRCNLKHINHEYYQKTPNMSRGIIPRYVPQNVQSGRNERMPKNVRNDKNNKPKYITRSNDFFY